MNAHTLFGTGLMFAGGLLMGFVIGWGGAQVWETGIAGDERVLSSAPDVGPKAERGQDQ